MSNKRHTPADEPHFLIRTMEAPFVDGQVLALHAHPWGQLICATEGLTSAWTEQGSWLAPPGWAVWAPPNVPHAMRFSGAGVLRTLYLRPAHWPTLPLRSGVITLSRLLHALTERAIAIGMLDDRNPMQVALSELIAHELSAAPAQSLSLPLPRTPALRRLAETMAQAPADRTTGAALAAGLGFGLRTLERRFAAETGLSLGQWRTRMRFLHALSLLGGGAPVKMAARAAGYQSPSAFVAAFRSALHTTPARYFAG